MQKCLIIGLLVTIGQNAMSMHTGDTTYNNTYGKVEKIEVQGDLHMTGHSDTILLATAALALGVGYVIGKKDASCVIL